MLSGTASSASGRRDSTSRGAQRDPYGKSAQRRDPAPTQTQVQGTCEEPPQVVQEISQDVVKRAVQLGTGLPIKGILRFLDVPTTFDRRDKKSTTRLAYNILHIDAQEFKRLRQAARNCNSGFKFNEEVLDPEFVRN